MSYQLVDLVEQLGTPNVLVLGDLILDRYIWGDAERISQEAPVILLHEERQENRLGGAANVAHMLRALEANVTLAGVLGADEDGGIARKELARLKIDDSAVLADESRPTTTKMRFMGRAQYRHPHQMLRVDREVRHGLSADLAEQLLQLILPRLAEFQAVLVSDYAKGVCTPAVLQPIISAARELDIPVIVDPANSGLCEPYYGCTAVTPNRLETFRATGQQVNSIDDAFTAGAILCQKIGLDYAFVTLDRDGIAVVHKDGRREHLPTRPREVCDITGAGDMVMAMIGVGTAAGINPEDLARLANIAGGLEVEQNGVVPIRRSEILADLLGHHTIGDTKLGTLPQIQRQVAARKKVGQKVVLTNGCFDLLHAGHVSYLKEAAQEGDCLVVAINSDASVRRLGKGEDRPIFEQSYRAEMLAALEAVDYVVVFDEDTPHAILEAIQPDVLVKGGTYQPHEIVGKEVVEAYGGRVKAMGAMPGLSTTEILRRLRDVSPPTIRLPDPRVPGVTYVDPAIPERKAG